jgi:hypothetical protein
MDKLELEALNKYSSGYMEVAVDEESFRLSDGTTVYSPQTGSDHEGRTIFEIGVGERAGRADYFQLEKWAAAFAASAAHPQIEISFDDFAESELDWSDDSTGEDYWGELESDLSESLPAFAANGQRPDGYSQSCWNIP